MSQIVTDLTMTLVKSTPSGLVLDDSIDAIIGMNLQPCVAKRTLPSSVQLFNCTTSELQYALSGNLNVASVSVPAKLNQSIYCNGLAVLKDSPDKFKEQMLLRRISPLNEDFDMEWIKQTDVAKDADNFVDQFVAGRALCNWVLRDVSQLDPSRVRDYYHAFRDTMTGLPPGDYVYEMRLFVRVHSIRTADVNNPPHEFQFNMAEWSYDHHSGDEFYVHPCTFEVTITIGKTSRHSNSKSVDISKRDTKSNVNSDKEQETPTPQLGE